ncbi:MAG: DUF4268 domain-containing protein [Planctomycetaceae bacterium]|nr:DUF4268 domain-containing protein [Planctomycetaceae bacterium]
MSSNQLGQLTRVDLREAWASEAGDFTPWLADAHNIRLLGETIGIELEVEAQEKNVGPFRADILCKDTANDTWVLIENQLERTDHSHLGQLLTYAAGLQAVTIVWIAARFADEHRAAIDWLNETTEDRIVFFALEVELWKIGDSALAPKFNVVSSPNDWSRSVSGAAKAINQGELSESKQRYLEFWSFFNEQLQLRKSPLRSPKPSGDYWKNFSVGRSEFNIVAMVSARDEWIGVQLTLRGDNAKRHFAQLLLRKDKIEHELEAQLQWRELPDGKESQVVLVRHDIDLKNPDNRQEIADWLISNTERFVSVFRPVVQNIGVEDDLDADHASNPSENS